LKHRAPHYQRGLPFHLGAASRGPVPDATALYLRALALFRGEGVKQDFAAARRLHAEAAERGVLDAQFELSLLLAQGIGGKRDARGAARWEAKAAAAGHSRACLNLASRLASKKKPDYTGAIQWYERAADGGSAEAAARLCKMYLLGQGLTRDEATAKRWFERAAALGYDWVAENR
jgi:TPR repeat protein